MTKAKSSKKTSEKRRPRIDKTGGDVIRVSNVGPNAAVAAGRGAQASARTVGSQVLDSDMAKWRSEMERRIDSLSTVSVDDKQDLKQQVAKVEKEAVKADKADPSRLEKLLNTLAVMGPDILDVAVTTISNPLRGIGLVIKKINDRVKIERQAQMS